MKNRLRLSKKESWNPLHRHVLIAGLLVTVGLSLNLSLVHASSFGLADRVVEQKLANGLTVLMVERHQTPVVSLNMTFGVGGVNEQVGQTGLAHLYEHMAFKGTRTVGTKDYEKERPILEEWFRVGTELEQRQRELARKSQERPFASFCSTTRSASPNEDACGRSRPRLRFRPRITQKTRTRRPFFLLSLLNRSLFFI